MASGDDIVRYAQQFIGTPYVWGGNDLRKGIDCSGLVQQVYKQYGINLPRTTFDQIGQGAPVTMKGLRPGDMVFFETTSKTKGPDHIGIYMGGGKIIHAPRPGKSVEIADMTKGYYADRFVGGRRMKGVKVVGDNVNDYEVASDMQPRMSQEEQAANYGWSFGFLSSNEELKEMYAQAVSQSWTPEQFQARMRDTTWWKDTADSRRQAQVTKTTDPATWSAMVDAAVMQVRQTSAQIGAAVPDKKLKGIATDMLEAGMDEAQLRNALAGYIDFSKNGTLLGEAGMFETKVRQFAGDYGVNIDSQTIKKNAQLMIKGLYSQEDFMGEMREAAKSMLPGYAAQIDGGQTVKQLASPYLQMMSKELDMPVESIGLDNPLIREAMNGLNQEGKPTGMRLTDFQSRLRSDPRWNGTTEARNSLMSTGRTVLRDMGLVN